MTDAPFRELFVELPSAVFETLRGIGEAAVAQATQPPPPPAIDRAFESAEWTCCCMVPP